MFSAYDNGVIFVSFVGCTVLTNNSGGLVAQDTSS